MAANQQIKKLIDTLGITPNAFASKLGIKATSVYNILNDKNNPSYELLEKIIETFSVNPNWILQDKGDVFYNINGNSEQKNIIESNREFFDSDDILNRFKGLNNNNYEYQQIINYEQFNNSKLRIFYRLELDSLRETYNNYKILIEFIHSLKPYGDFWNEKFKTPKSFDTYFQGLQQEWKEDFEYMEDKKLRLIMEIIDLNSYIEHWHGAISRLISYIDQYRDFFTDKDKL